MNSGYFWQVIYKRYIIMLLGASVFEDVPLVEFMHLVFTRMPGDSYRGRRLRSSLLCSCDVFHGARINSLVCWFCAGALGLVLFQIGLFLAPHLSPLPPPSLFLLCSTHLRSKTTWRVQRPQAFKSLPSPLSFVNNQSGKTETRVQPMRLGFQSVLPNYILW